MPGDLTAHDIEQVLRDELGLNGQDIIAHASLSALGPVHGGEKAVLAAILAAAGTVVMPAFTYQTQVIPHTGPPDNAIEYGTGDSVNARAEIFRPDLPVHPDCGTVAEPLRRDASTLRSTHPILSFVAQGPHAREVLASQTRDAQADSRAQREELTRQETLIIQQQDRLLNMRLSDDIDQEVFAKKHTELRDRLASIKLQLDVLDRSHDETAELAAKVFELSQTLRDQWLTADYAAKRRLLEIVFLNCVLDDVTLVPEMRKPFDVLAEGLVSEKSRGERI